MSDNPLRPLSDEQVEGAAGGYLYYAGDEYGVFNRWEVIDDKGDVVERFSLPTDAAIYARRNNLSYQEITWEQLERLRKTGSID